MISNVRSIIENPDGPNLDKVALSDEDVANEIKSQYPGMNELINKIR